MNQSPRNTILRETYSPSTKKLLMEKSLTGKTGDFDQDDTVKTRFSPSRNNHKRQSPDSIRLRSTYSPATFSSKYLGDIPKVEGIPQINWKSSARISSFSPKSITRRPSEIVGPEKGLSKIQSQLNTLEQRVNNAIKELSSKNSRKSQPSELKAINQDNESVYFAKGYELEKTRSIHSERSIQKRRSSNNHQSSDLKATLKIPELSKLVTTVPKPKQAHGFTTNPYSPRNHNIYYVSELVRAIDDDNSLAKQHVKSAIKILKILENVTRPSHSDLEHRRLELSRSEFYRDKKTLVFDLDQTLIHCNESPTMPSDIKLTIKMQTGQIFEAGINIRPYALTLLHNLASKFELILFTASHSSYANVVLDYLDPDKKLFQHRLYREHCYYTQTGVYVKDLRIINRNSSQMALIDNAAYSYAFQIENGIPILSYYEGQDFELKALEKYLERVLFSKDLRELNKQTFKLHHYTKFDTPEELIEQLYMEN